MTQLIVFNTVSCMQSILWLQVHSISDLSITGSATALQYCNAHSKVNRKTENSTPYIIVTPENYILKLGTRDYVENITHYTNFHIHRFSGGFSTNRWKITHLWLFLTYLGRVSSHFDEIWHSDADRHSWRVRPLKIRNCENLEKIFWKISWKIQNAISRPRLDRFQRNLARWRSSTLSTVPTVKTLKFQKSKMAAAAILKNRRIAIFRPRLDRFWRIFARLSISKLLTVPTVKNLKFQKSKLAAAAVL